MHVVKDISIRFFFTLVRFYGGVPILPLLSKSPQSPLPSIWLETKHGKKPRKETKLKTKMQTNSSLNTFWQHQLTFSMSALATSLLFQLSVAAYKKILREQQVTFWARLQKNSQQNQDLSEINF